MEDQELSTLATEPISEVIDGEPTVENNDVDVNDGNNAENADDEAAEMTNDTEERSGKSRFALIFAYIGTGYNGSQKNPGIRTIEDEIEKALYACDLVEPENRDNFMKIGFNRAARTDKGVHAAGNVVSFLMRLAKGDEQRTVDRLNAVLPSQVRVVDLVRVTRNFNSKNLCSARRYGYILPTVALRPKQDYGYLCREPSSLGDEERQQYSRLHHDKRDVSERVADLVADRFSNGSARVCVRQGVFDNGVGHYLVHGVALTPSSIACKENSEREESSPDSYRLGTSFFRGIEEAREARRLLAEEERARGYRVDQNTLKRFKAALQRYVGTHSFHNFSPRLSCGDATASRFIMEFKCSEPFFLEDVVAKASSCDDSSLSSSGIPHRIVDFLSKEDQLQSESELVFKTQYVHVSIMGQSFLLNQIRHMIGLAVDVARGAAPPATTERAFGKVAVHLPLAPAEGLFLEQCLFQAYDKRFGADHQLMSVFAPAALERHSRFKVGRIFKQIHECCAAERVFQRYIGALDAQPFNYKMRPVSKETLEQGRATGAVSKTAKEKAEFKTRMKLQRERTSGTRRERADENPDAEMYASNVLLDVKREMKQHIEAVKKGEAVLDELAQQRLHSFKRARSNDNNRNGDNKPKKFVWSKK